MNIDAPKPTFLQRVLRFVKAHPVLTNFVVIIIAFIVVVWLLGVVFLNKFTNHGDTVTVPLVKGMKVDVATNALHENGFSVELDSIYDLTGIPGTVIDQSPSENSKVKDGRTIYLRYVCYSPRMITVPAYADMGRRGALAAFRSLGINDIKVKEMSSSSSRVAARYNGVLLKAGDQIPANAAIVLEVPAESYIEETFGSDYDEEFVPADINDAGNGVFQEDEDEEFLRSLNM